MEMPFKPWPLLEAYAKLFPSERFPGLFYYDYEQRSVLSGGKPALILIHGLGDEADSWRHLIPLLGDAGYRVLAPDLPGFGRSPCSKKANLNYHRDMILEFVESAAANSRGAGVVLIGSSMGAAIAQGAALAEFRQRRDINKCNIKALVFLDGCLPFDKRPSGSLLLSMLPFVGSKWYRSFRADPKKAWRSLFSYYAGINNLSKEDKDFLRVRVMDRVNSFIQERSYFSSLRSTVFNSLRKSYYNRIGTWPGKLALLWGEKDIIIPRSQAEAMVKLRAHYPTAYALISGAGHLPHQEKPAQTAEAILEFLS